MQFDVQYFDAQQEQLLKNNLDASYHPVLDSLRQNGFECTPDEFAIHFVFREKGIHRRFMNYDDCARNYGRRLDTIRDYLEIDGTILKKSDEVMTMDKPVIEGAGVAGGVILLNRLFGMTKADWTSIPIGRVKALDFWIGHNGSGQYGSNGKTIVQLETKGTLGPIGSRYSQKNSIVEKKEVQKLKQPNAVLIGTITHIASNDNERSFCELVDPPPVDMPFDPDHHQVLARMSFYRNVLAGIAKSQLVALLNNRIDAVAAARDYRFLDGRILKNSNGRRISTPKSWRLVQPDSDRPLDIYGRCHCASGSANHELVYIGCQRAVLDSLIAQDFHALCDYEHESSIRYEYTSSTPAIITVSGTELERLGYRTKMFRQVGTGDRYEVAVSGYIYLDESGMVIGEFSILGPE